MASPISHIQSKTIVPLYRALLRLGRRFDEAPAAKSLIYRNTLRLADDVRPAPPFPSNPYASTAADPTSVTLYYSDVLDRVLLKGRSLYLPSPSSPSRRFQELVRSEFRRDFDSFSTNDRIDAAFALLRKLSMIFSRYQDVLEEDTEFALSAAADGNQFAATETNNSRISSQQQPKVDHTMRGGKSSMPEAATTTTAAVERRLTIELVSKPAAGLLLVAHPLLTGSLHRTIILLLEHSDRGSYGVVLNVPTHHTLSSAVKNLPQDFVSRFSMCRVNFGGMIHRMQWIHNVPNIGGTPIPFCSSTSSTSSFVAESTVESTSTPTPTPTPVVNRHNQLFAGGSIAKALSYARRRNVKTVVDQFTFFVGCCTWEPDQLERELSSGFWMLAKSQPDLLLQLSLSGSNAAADKTDLHEESAVAGTGTDEDIEDDEDEKRARRTKYRNGREVRADSMDVYQFVCDRVGDEPFAKLPGWLDSTMVESCDWQA
jgi:putative AlgH/UPF0301 family transcriptional regulator